MKSNWSTAALAICVLLLGVASASAQLDDIVLLHAGGDNGQISVLDSDTLLIDSTVGGQGFGAFPGSKVVVQSDNNIVTAINTQNPNPNGIFSRRMPDDLANPTREPDGLGRPISALLAYNDAAGFEDYIFFGYNDLIEDTGIPFSNMQVRDPALLRIATVGADGFNGGPSGISDDPNGADGPISGAVMDSSGDLIHLWENLGLGFFQPGQRGRIRRQQIGDLATGFGPDNPFGLDGLTGEEIYGVGLDIRSDDLLVIAKSNRIVELRPSDTLSPDLGGFEVNTGQFIGGTGVPDGKFADDVTALGVLSDDRFVVGLANGELSLWSVDLAAPGLKITRDQNVTLACPSGDCTINAIGVQSDDDIIVGTDEGRLFRLDTTLSDIITPIDGFGRIDDIAFLHGNSVTVPGDKNGDGRVDGVDFLLHQQDDANLIATQWEPNFGTDANLETAANVVPEPASLVPAFLALFLGINCRRR